MLQGDEELASALNAYTEARRRLSEKVKSRGFWPLSQNSKGKSKGYNRGVKGKFQKGHPLQQKIPSAAHSELQLQIVRQGRTLEGRMSVQK